ncbi:unnamed protein product, partial [Adineta steineri]
TQTTTAASTKITTITTTPLPTTETKTTKSTKITTITTTTETITTSSTKTITITTTTLPTTEITTTASTKITTTVTTTETITTESTKEATMLTTILPTTQTVTTAFTEISTTTTTILPTKAMTTSIFTLLEVISTTSKGDIQDTTLIEKNSLTKLDTTTDMTPGIFMSTSALPTVENISPLTMTEITPESTEKMMHNITNVSTVNMTTTHLPKTIQLISSTTSNKVTVKKDIIPFTIMTKLISTAIPTSKTVSDKTEASSFSWSTSTKLSQTSYNPVTYLTFGIPIILLYLPMMICLALSVYYRRKDQRLAGNKLDTLSDSASTITYSDMSSNSDQSASLSHTTDTFSLMPSTQDKNIESLNRLNINQKRMFDDTNF